MLEFHILLVMTVYYKMRHILLQNKTAILFQNVTEVYYKMRHSLQNETILLQNAIVITKCDVYYKLRQYKLQK